MGQTSEGAAIGRRAFGRSGEQVSSIGVGGFHLGLCSEDEAVRIVRAALDAGVTFLDNCWDYHAGKSEERMGRALAGGHRRRAFLMTKLDGRTAASATAQLEQSLRRLQTDCIDLVQIHEVIRADDPERCFAAGGCIEALLAARQAGKLRYLGFTGHKHPDLHLAMLDRAARAGFRFDAVQMPLNAMDAHFRSFEHKLLPRLQAEGIAAIGMKSMGAGELLKAKVASPQELLRYALTLPVSLVVTGCDSMSVLEQNLEVARTFTPMSAGERAELLSRTREAALSGQFEPFKTTGNFDGTDQFPHWLTEARF